MVAVSLVGFPAVTVLVLAGVFGQAPDPEFAGVAPERPLHRRLRRRRARRARPHHHPRAHRHPPRAGRAAPLPGLGARRPLLVGREVVLGVVLGTVSAAIVLVAGGAVYGLQAPEDPLACAGWFLVGLACFIAIGVALGSLLPSGRAATAVGNLLFVPMFLLGGGGPPREVMTAPMQTISDVLPLSHVIGGLRQSWLGPPTTPTRSGGPSSSPPSPSSSPSAPPDGAPSDHRQVGRECNSLRRSQSSTEMALS